MGIPMKDFLKIILTLFIGIMALAGPVSAKEALTPDEAKAIAEEAYIYAYPMMENYKTLYSRYAENGQMIFNTFLHRHKLMGPEFKRIVAPNNDTLYSSVWLDLRAEPLVVTVPNIPEERYYSLQFIDLFVYNFAYIGQRETGSKGGSYLIVGPGQKAPDVPGIRRVYPSESDFVFCIGRILAKNTEDQEIAAGFQRQFKVEPLSAFLKKQPPSPPEPVDFLAFDPAKAKSEHFIEYFNFLVRHANIHPSDEAAFETFKKIGIGPGAHITLDKMEPGLVTSIREGVMSGYAKIQAETKKIGTRVAGWNTTFKGYGTRDMMKGDHLTHAAGAMIGLYGHNPLENSSFSRQADSEQIPFDGAKNQYVLRFEKDRMPPAKAFWSLTLYRMPEVLLSANELNRYAIGDRTTGLQYGKDGALTLYIQNASPGKELESNWLPSPEGPFMLALRVYLPGESLFNGSWQPPEVIRQPVFSGDTNYDPMSISGAKIEIIDTTAKDQERSRDIPIRIFLPPEPKPAPVVLFSHGLGGSCKMNAFMGEHWAARGFFTVFVQHPGSDVSVWQDLPREERMKALAQAANLKTFQDRVKDVSFVLDTLAVWNQTPDSGYAGKMDLNHAGMAGHSFGAVTTQAVSGQRTVLGKASFTDSRITAAMMLSPSQPKRGSAVKAFGEVGIPWMIMTGTRDVSAIGEGELESRLAVYPALPPGGKYELVLDGAEHSAFTDRALPGDTEQRNPNHHRAILAISTAFWDAYLKKDDKAKAWLDGNGPRTVLEEKDRWQKK